MSDVRIGYAQDGGLEALIGGSRPLRVNRRLVGADRLTKRGSRSTAIAGR